MNDGAFFLTGLLLLIVLLGGGCAVYPQYNVYSQTLSGKARLAEAESSRQIQVREAQAALDSAKLLNQAEVERAKGAAEANLILGNSLKNNEPYLRYLWIQSLENANNKLIYVPTEAGLPVLEAGRGVVP